MAVRVFKESQVRTAILKKANVQIKSGKRSPHMVAWLEHNGIKYAHIRIPNPHSKEFWEGKGNALAADLKLTHPQYNDFVSCKMSKTEYELILDLFFNPQQ